MAWLEGEQDLLGGPQSLLDPLLKPLLPQMGSPQGNQPPLPLWMEGDNFQVYVEGPASDALGPKPPTFW